MAPMKFLSDSLVYTADAADLPAGFWPLAQLPLVIVVGLTGVGKSTVIELLPPNVKFTPLPNRRQLTDDIIITTLQLANGETPQPVTDRLKRFEYTARYREQFGGGMAHALSRLAARVEAGSLLLFDGLRGLDEIRYGAQYLPNARFLVLDAPDLVRLARLVKRRDAFDQVERQRSPAGQTLIDRLAAIAGIETVFTAADLREIERLARAEGWLPDDVLKKAAVIIEERRNYDSRAARDYLTRALPPQQLLVVDSAAQPADAIAAQVTRWLALDHNRQD